MKLSVVITCRDDRRILSTIASVDAPVEIVVVLNGSPEGFESWLREHCEFPAQRMRIETLPHPSRSRSVEHGIRAASNDRVLLMDTDCLFAPGSVAAFARAMDAGDPSEEVYKGRLIYEAGPSRIGAVIAASRQQRNQRLSAYKPALGFSRSLAGRLGGYFFDERLIWKSDAELDARIRRAGLRLVAVDDCSVHHAALSLRSDLYSSFHYGVGAAIAAHLGLQLPEAERSSRRALARDGLGPAAYMALSNRIRQIGRCYAQTRLRVSGKPWLDRVVGA